VEASKTPPPKAVPAHVPPELVVDFDLYDPPGADTDFHGAWKALQDRAPDIVWTTANGGHWIALRGKQIHEIFSDYVHFSSKVIIVPRERGDLIKVKPTTLDPPVHRPYRALLNAGLSPKAVREMEPEIRSLVAATIEGFRARGHCEFISEFAEVLPISIFMRMVNLPVDDVRFLKPWADQINRPDGTMEPDEVMRRFAGYLQPHVRARREAPGTDLLSQIVTGLVNGAPLPETDAIELCTQVLIGGMDTVVSFLGFMMIFLARNPAHRRQLLDDRGLIWGAVDEFLRRFPIVQNGRLVVSDYEFSGVPMKAGEVVIMPGVLHGLDEREHADPLTVDFHRKSGEHSTFGNGAHRCPGAILARTELRITLEEWLERIPDFRIMPGTQPITQGGIVGCVKELSLQWDLADRGPPAQ
jgi:cytochrome P450